MNITIEQIEQFVLKAISEGYCVRVSNNNMILIDDGNANGCNIQFEGDHLNVYINKHSFIVNVDEIGYHKFCLLYDVAKKHDEEEGEIEFASFFDEKPNKPTDINDLDED